MKKEFNVATKEEIEALQSWFKEHEDKIPANMQIDSATYVPDLKKTINQLMGQACICYENPYMQSCIQLLKSIKMNIEKNNLL